MSKNFLIDYYEDLQVSSNADIETIERVYRLLAKRYHPDNNGSGNTEKFTRITEAYKVLTDPEKRAAFDVKYEKERFMLKLGRIRLIPELAYGNWKN
jgi:curved DNA-binding protein CbpA